MQDAADVQDNQQNQQRWITVNLGECPNDNHKWHILKLLFQKTVGLQVISSTG